MLEKFTILLNIYYSTKSNKIDKISISQIILVKCYFHTEKKTTKINNVFSCHSGSVTFPSSVLPDHRTPLSPTGDYTRALEPSFQDNENANMAEGSFSRQRSARHNLHCTEMTFGFGLIGWILIARKKSHKNSVFHINSKKTEPSI